MCMRLCFCEYLCVQLHAKWEIYYTAEQGLILHMSKGERERIAEKCLRLLAVLLARLLKEWNAVEWTTAIFFLTKLCRFQNGLNVNIVQDTNNMTLKTAPQHLENRELL